MTWRSLESDFQDYKRLSRQQSSKTLAMTITIHLDGNPAYSVLYGKQMCPNGLNLPIKLLFDTIQAPFFSQIEII